MQPGSGGADEPTPETNAVARMMMSVAGQAIMGYVQFRSLVELLIDKGVLTREELEQHFTQTREADLHRTIDEWFPSDIAYHVKMALQSSEAGAAAYESSAVPSDVDEIARARAVQSGEQ